MLLLMALWAILLSYVFNPLVHIRMSIGVFYLLAAVVWLVAFALLCGNLRRSLVTVVNCTTTALFLDVIFVFSEFLFRRMDDLLALHIGAMAHLANELYYLNFLPNYIKILLYLLWAVFYYRVSRKYPVKLPLRSWLLIVLPPAISSGALIYLWTIAVKLLETGTNIFGLGLGMGIFLFLLNCFLFYWHISILATRQAEETLDKLRKEAPPEKPDTDTPFDSGGLPERVWTPQEGFIDAFAVKHKLSPREKQALELLLLGNSDKAIALEMGVSINSVGVYLRRLYAKTGVSGRFDILTMVHTGKNLGIR
ncbi:hypothetical protein FACS1894163_00100 [Spirochaetia bacterium]|nr:hypothetical protein FACS1894163_00100 [Spirochaetia bacterium]